MSKQVDDLKKSRNSFEYDLDALLDYIDALEAEIDDLVQERNDLQTQVKDLEEEIEASAERYINEYQEG